MVAPEANRFVIPKMNVVLRQKGPGQVWTARYMFDIQTRDRGRIERSTGKTDLEEAIGAALVEKGILAEQIKAGWRSGSKPKFADIADEYLAALDRVVNRRGDGNAGFLG